MNIIKFTKNLKKYELSYWNAHKYENNTRSSVMVSLFKNEIIKGDIAVDVGCGPNCGIFNELTFPAMYAVDPLWAEYDINNISKKILGVTIINSTAEDFKLDKKADVIFSFNALDHSGCLKNSFNNIMFNLKENGKFYFHIHLRTKEQLNTGHRMVITEKDIDTILSPYVILNKTIYDICPLDNKNYRSYVAIVSRKESIN